MSALADARWHWTADAYEHAAAIGAFGPDAKVELIDGEVIAVASMLPGHAVAVSTLHLLASLALDPLRWSVGSQTPVRLSDDTEPEPDLWVARGPLATYGRRHPGPDDLALVVEVADTSLALDRDVKVPRYLAAGVPEVWLLSLPGRTLTVSSRRGSVVHPPADTVVQAETGLHVAVEALLAHLDG